MDELRVTRADDIVLPVIDVELLFLKDREGRPVVVRCEAVDEEVMAELYGNPGLIDARAIPKDEDRYVRYLIETGPTLVMRATALRGAGEGEWLRPAFHVDDAKAAPGSIPWRMVRWADKAAVVDAILRCSGYGGAAAGPSFSHGDGAGRRRGDGAGRARAGRGKKSARRPARR